MRNLTAKDIMTAQVITVSEDLPVSKLAKLLTNRMISGAPVVDQEGNLIGVVSLSDIVESYTHHGQDRENVPHGNSYQAALADKLNEEDSEGLHLELEDGLLVQDIMTPAVIHVTEETVVAEMAQTMLAGRLHRLIVTKNHKVVGIVTTIDMLKVIALAPQSQAIPATT